MQKLLVIFLLSIPISVINASSQELTTTQATAFLDQFQAILLDVQLGKPVSSESFKQFPTEYQKFLEILKFNLDNFTSASNDYSLALQSYNFETFLSPLELSQAKGDSFELNLLLSLVQNLRTATKNFYVGFPKQVQLMNIDKSFRSNFLKGWHKTSANAEKIVSLYLENQEEILKLIKRIRQLCIESKPSYSEAENQLLFDKASDVQRYNSMLGKLSTLALEESEIIAKLSDLNNKNMQKFIQKREELGM